jgi:hypothetical protein
MINKILKVWLDAHEWLKLATIENDLGLPKKFLTSEMQDTKALVKACFALQDYGFKIAPGLFIERLVDSEKEIVLEYLIDSNRKKSGHTMFIKDVEMYLVKQISGQVMSNLSKLNAFGLELYIKDLKIKMGRYFGPPRNEFIDIRKAVAEYSSEHKCFSTDQDEEDPTFNKVPVFIVYRLKTPINFNGNNYEAVSFNDYDCTLEPNYDKAVSNYINRLSYGILNDK